MKKKHRLRGSLLAKLTAFFILVISFIIGAIAAMIISLFINQNVYYYQSTQAATQVLARGLMVNYAWEDMHEFREWYFSQAEQSWEGHYGNDRNFGIELWQGDELCWSSYDMEETPYSFTYIFDEWVQDKEKSEAEGQPKYTLKEFTCYLYVDQDFPYDNEYRMAYNQAVYLCELRYICPIVAVVAALVSLLCFIFLMCSAGHKKGEEEIKPSILTPIHLDVLTLIFGGITLMGLIVFFEGHYGDAILNMIASVGIGTILLVWCTIYCMEFALRLKMGDWWKHSIIYVIACNIWKLLRFLCKGMVALIKGLPLILNTVIVFAGICIVEFIGLCIWASNTELVVLWFLEKMILIPIVLYIALVCKKLLEGSAALAEGNLNYKVDTSKMFLDFKEHGENLNQIGQGISRAVNERMKSEHLKTELITNVSHDLKTPLTSIINYADLLGNAAVSKEGMEPEKVAEYSEVLLRQSKRLKKLLDDLVEASKATTGNLEVNLEKCEVGVLLSQAVGEYEARINEKQLELITKQPEEPIWIMADGRRLWRVFDNLLSNICKYAQESSRVYLTVESKEGQVEIIFRNMSKYPLELTAKELEERFVRGDKSRHMEGNGLGLSIAKSLVELQNGSLEIITDGDLFKVILRFTIVD